jgi:hypothetical protein
MTIEIKQLIVRASAEPEPERASERERALDVPAPTAAPGFLPREARAALIASCVREVLRELERTRQR